MHTADIARSNSTLSGCFDLNGDIGPLEARRQPTKQHRQQRESATLTTTILYDFLSGHGPHRVTMLVRGHLKVHAHQ
jgi:hypothetical protein